MLGPGGPPVPSHVLSSVLWDQSESLEKLRLGHIGMIPKLIKTDFHQVDQIGLHLKECHRLEEVAIEWGAGGPNSAAADGAMKLYGDALYNETLRLHPRMRVRETFRRR